jgi:hypothetical protein
MTWSGDIWTNDACTIGLRVDWRLDDDRLLGGGDKLEMYPRWSETLDDISSRFSTSGLEAVVAGGFVVVVDDPCGTSGLEMIEFDVIAFAEEDWLRGLKKSRIFLFDLDILFLLTMELTKLGKGRESI